MATSREETGRYDGGLGAGGKFKRRPFRKTSQATPYDRPPTAIRNPGSGNGNGWLSKLMDPAQRLIAYSANKLFASVFRKRLAPPPAPESSEPETNQESRENFQDAALTGPPVRQEGAQDGSDGIPAIQSDKFTDLEAILKQKTFTRAEIDHLTTLLRARSADNASETEEKRSEVKLSVSRKEEFSNTPSRENGTERPHISSSLVISNVEKVPDEDIASPAQLAKAYMGSQPSKVSTPMLTLRSQSPKEKVSVPSSSLFSSKSPAMSLVPRSSAHNGGLENAYLPARSRGRSAIYNMARTPYSRANASSALKNAVPRVDALAGLSSSPQSPWDQSRLSVSRQVALKRRLDVDIGSVGPIRRIRQKSNLFSPRSLASPPSGSPPSIHENESGSEARNSLSLMNKPFSSVEVKDAVTKAPSENGFSGTPVPSKSSQMASKILNQLNEMVSTREKSPTKLSPSMLSGQALKSLEHVDSSKFLEKSRGKQKVEGLDGASLPAIRGSMSNKQDKLEENGRMKFVNPSDKSVSLANGVGSSNLFKEIVPSSNAAASLSMKSVAPLPQQKKRAFQMSAHEDYLDLDDDDDDDQPIVAASSSFAIKKEKVDVSVTESKNIAPEPTRVERPSPVSEIKPITSSVVNQKPDSSLFGGYMSAEKNTSTTSEAKLLSTSSQAAVLASPPTSVVDKPAPTEIKPESPIKEQNGSMPTFSFGSGIVNKVQSATETSGFKLDGSSDSKPGNLNSFESVAPTANNAAKSDESTKVDNNISSKPGFLFSSPALANSSAASTTSTSGSIFKFGGAANTSNGSVAATSLFSSQPSPVIPNNNAGAGATVTTAATTNSASPQPSVPLFTSTASFNTTPAVNASNQSSATEVQTKDTTSGSALFTGISAIKSSSNSIFGFTSGVTSNPSSSSASGTGSAVPSFGNNPFGGLDTSTTATSSSSSGASSLASSTSNIFGVTSSTPSTASGMFSSTPANTATGRSVFGFNASASTVSAPSFTAGSSVATSTQSTTTTASPLFGLAGNTASATGGSLSFGSGATFGFKASSSDSNAVSTSSASTVNIFGSSWAAPKSTPTPIFSATSTPNSSSASAGFAFGASSTSTASNTTAPVVFGSSTTTPSNSIFPFSSASASTPSQPGFGSSTPGFAFGIGSSAPASNNDQMEDSMAEDNVQAATPSMPVFGQQPATPATPSMPVYGQQPAAPAPVFGQQPAAPAPVFGQQPATPAPVFGQQPATPPSSGFIFGSTATSGTNPFQFGGQQSIGTPQTPNPFQASSSAEFNTGGGSFSLGSSGVDKSNRRIVRPKSNRLRKK